MAISILDLAAGAKPPKNRSGVRRRPEVLNLPLLEEERDKR